MADEGVVHVVDDDEAMRDSLAFLLDCAGIAARTYDSAAALLAAAGTMARGCIVTDVRMPGLSGLELAEKLKGLGIADPVIVITGHGDVPLAVQAMKAGVVDFIEKPFGDDHFLSAVRAALAQGSGRREEEEERRRVADRLAALSAREREVLDRLVDGKPNKIIAVELGISARTVEIYRANLMTKMQAASLSQLVRMSLLAGPA
jgi:two-component system response regulator FixJ